MLFVEGWAVVLSILAVWLAVQRNRLCWSVGLVPVLLYGWIFWHVRLYSDMLLQGVYAVLAIYGWWRWNSSWTSAQHLSKHVRRRRDTEWGHHNVRVMPIPRRICILGLLIGAVGSMVLGALTARLTDAALPWIDAALTSFSLVAEFWKTRRYIAHWRLWIVVDSVYVGMFAFKGLYLTALLYAAFIILAVIGLRNWQQANDDR